MPKDWRLYAAHAYIAHPVIHTGYKINKGGLGTVIAIVKLQPIEIAHANNSTQKRNRLLSQSFLIHSNVESNISFIRAIYRICTTKASPIIMTN